MKTSAKDLEKGPDGRLERMQKQPFLRMIVKVVTDAGIAGLAWTVAVSVLYQSYPTSRGVAFWVVFSMIFNIGFKLHTQHYRLLGFPEAKVFLLNTVVLFVVAAFFILILNYRRTGLEGTDVVIFACLLTPPLWFALRVGFMRYHQRKYHVKSSVLHDPKHGGSFLLSQRTLIVGAGTAGMRLCQELIEHPKLRCKVVGFVDDDSEKQGVRINGIPVLGPTELLATYIKTHRVSLVVLGHSNLTSLRIRELSKIALSEGISVKVVPGILNLVGDRSWKPELRDVAIEDLLCREPITLDTAAIRRVVKDSVVLITGAGGSIGGELARRVAQFEPKHLVLLGRGENSLWEMALELARTFPTQSLAVELCDIRNPTRLNQVFNSWRPQMVLHAAAHKHVPILEAHPEEAIENNVFGTMNVVEAAILYGTKTFVNISTDKAVNPSSVLGVSKRIAEQLVLDAAFRAPAGSRYVSVRFGNVLGSRGSVIRIFREQIKNGGPITVTDPAMARYFMTIPEASQLVLHAGSLGETGKVFVLDMGEPVLILDLATAMARLSGFEPGVDIEITFTGMRPGEKLVEVLFDDREKQKTDMHPKIFDAVQDQSDLSHLHEGIRALKEAIALPEDQRHPEILRWFKTLVPTYQLSTEGFSCALSADCSSKAGSPSHLQEIPGGTTQPSLSKPSHAPSMADIVGPTWSGGETESESWKRKDPPSESGEDL